jgi:hypothetical protein
MGMFDSVFIVDAPWLLCPEGHALRSFQTKDLAQPSMNTYLLCQGRLCLARAEPGADDEDSLGWRIQGDRAIHERRYQLQEVRPEQALHIYATCTECEPVLVRSAATDIWGDIVREHALFVDFRLTFRAGEPPRIERQSGSREQLKNELRARGVFVLGDADPLAVAHRTLKKAREQHGEREGER